jgi:hypothetical protein
LVVVVVVVVVEILYIEDDSPGAVVKSSHWCQEVLGSSGLFAIIAGVRLAPENPPPDPT